MKLAYIKFNNGVEELRRVLDTEQSLDDGGAEAYVANMVKYAGTNSLLIVSFHDGDPDQAKLRAENVAAVSYRWPSHARGLNTVRRLWQSLRMLGSLIRFRPTHIYCWENNIPLWLAYLYARAARARFVSSVHTRLTNEGSTELNKLRATADNMVFRKSDRVVCHGPYLKKQLLEIGVDSERVIEFGWSYKSFISHQNPRAGAANDAGHGKKKIFFVGRIFSLKGVFDLFEAMKPILRENADTELLYIGSGPDLAELTSLVAAEGYASKVKLLGRVPYEDLADTLADGYVVVTPSRSAFPEGRCMAAIEAILLGIPVVAPNTGPFPYVLEHEREGLLYKADDVESLRQALARLIEDEAFHQQCASNALLTAKQLRNPEITFSGALAHALS